MDPLFAGLITGGANLLGNIFSSDTSAANTQANIAAQEMMQQQTQGFNAQQAEINRQYQTQMSNTAYQRSSQDMEKAGLNPMMMFGSGSAASTPGGAQASVGTPNMALYNKQSAFGGLGNAVSSGINSAISMKTMDKMTDEIANLQATRKEVEALTDNLRADLPKHQQEAITAGNIASLTGLKLPSARVSAKEAQGVEGLGEGFLKAAGIGKYAGQSISDIIAPFISGAGAVSRLSNEKLMRDIEKGNFIGRYGVPVDEYVGH